MLYAKIDNSNNVIVYPYTQETFKTENPSTKVPSDLSSGYDGTEDQVANNYSVVSVALSPAPDFDNNVEENVETNPTLVDGVWTQTWNTVALSAEEISANSAAIESGMRARRDRRIASSDWTQLGDAPLTDAQKADYVTYRQELRDIPTHANWPNLVDEDWPADPHGMLGDLSAV
jgi:hypothetical protein